MNRVQLQDESGIKSRFFSDLSLSVPDGLVAVRVSSGHLQGSVSLVQGDWRGDGWSHCVSLTSVLELVVSKVSKELQLPDY